MKLIEISNLFKIEKGSLQSSKNIEGDFTFITASANWKSHKTYTHNCEALIFAMGASGSLGRTHYFEGEFISSDLCFILTQKDNSEFPVNFKFYYHFFNFIKPILVERIATGTSKLAINRTNFKKYKIPYFPISYQKNKIALLDSIKLKQNILQTEIQTQKKLLTQLRQAILQEAVQGKLVPQDPTDEPASVLLERIKTEKEALVAAKKIRKPKYLPPISEEEKPFELPDGWVWCRLGEIGFIQGGGTPSKANPEFWNGDIPWICPKDMKKNYVDSSIYQITNQGVKGSSAKMIPKESLLFVVRGMILDHTFPVAINTTDVTINQDMKALTPYVSGVSKYLLYLLKGLSFQILKKVEKSTHGTCKLQSEIYHHLYIPLPSLSEQNRIVVKVQELLGHCEALEAEVLEREKQVAVLVQAVLGEAFGKP